MDLAYFSLFLTFLIFYAGEYLPLELLIFYIVEIVGDFVLHLIALSTIFITTGVIIERLGWRNGLLTFSDDRILINGKKEFYLKYDEITRIKYLKYNTLQVRTRYYPVRIKFKELEQLEQAGALIEKMNRGVTQPNIYESTS